MPQPGRNVLKPTDDIVETAPRRQPELTGPESCAILVYMITQPYYDKQLKALVVPGRQHTIATLVAAIDRVRQAKGMTSYAIAKTTGLAVSINAADRMFRGYQNAGQQVQDRVNDADSPGRVRLRTALQIIQAMGYDLELVARESPGRSDI